MKQKDDPSRRIRGNYPLCFDLRILFSDMDALRHVNNGAIGRFFEEGRATMNMHIFGQDAFATSPDGRLLLLANATVDYLAQVRYPGEITIATGVGRIGNSSYVVAQGAFQNQSCVALAEGIMVKAVADRPALLNDAERRDLQRVAFGTTTAS